jgi:hypothetical protein
MLKYICYNWFGTIANHCLDCSSEEYKRVGVTKLHDGALTPELVKPNDIVFVKTDFVYNGIFQRDYLPKITNPFILITGGSDYQVAKVGDDAEGITLFTQQLDASRKKDLTPMDRLSLRAAMTESGGKFSAEDRKKIISTQEGTPERETVMKEALTAATGRSIGDIINNSNVLRWYCTNAPEGRSNKIIPLPIGFEEPYSDREGGNQEILDQLRAERTSWPYKKDKILLPHHTLRTNPNRASLFAKLKSLPFVETQEEKLSFTDYVRKIDEYKFVICLEGSGPDLHRNYECLLVDSVPVNIKNNIHELFKVYNLPGEFVTSWNDLNTETFHSMMRKNYDMEASDKFLKISFHTKNIKGN